jgi:hypothetical protein
LIALATEFIGKVNGVGLDCHTTVILTTLEDAVLVGNDSPMNAMAVLARGLQENNDPTITTRH